MDLGTALSLTAERYPDRPGVVSADGRLSYREWDARTNKIARALLGLGVRPGDPVAMFLSNTEVLASTHLAAQKLGAMSTPLNVRLAPEELGYCIGDCRPSVVITDDTTVSLAQRSLAEQDHRPPNLHAGPALAEGAIPFDELVDRQTDAPPQVDVGEQDPSVLLYTSGTTGRPKGVPRSQRNEMAASIAHVIQARYADGERTLGAMPMYHTMGLRSLLSMILVGGTFVELPAFDADTGLALLESEQVTSLYLVPTAFWALHQTGRLHEAGRWVRKIGYAGAAMTSTLTEELAESLQPEVFINHYGSSEVYTFSIEQDAATKPGSAGRPGIFSRLRLAPPETDEHVPGEPPRPGDNGEVLASLASDEAFQGYWQRPDADERALRDGWYRSGDLGTIDEAGDLWIVGRVDDMIITGGENVHPVEVEDVLARCPEVSEVAVAGLPDQRWGQAVTAFVVPSRRDDPAGAAEGIHRWLGAEGSVLSSYKRPKQVVLVADIPKSPVGKVLRRKLIAGDYEPLHPDSDGRGGSDGS
ncbi:MAG: AMP-binding protein [Propionibacteriales bacterium]|nr:AMP-binding protein [Propionibacteriales bacterium]